MCAPRRRPGEMRRQGLVNGPAPLLSMAPKCMADQEDDTAERMHPTGWKIRVREVTNLGRSDLIEVVAANGN